MSKTEDIEAVVKENISPLGFELVDVEFKKEGGRWVLRLFIDKEGGVNISDCQAVSQRAGFFLDAGNVIGMPYNLEVSSPGLDRKLKKPDDFKKFTGKKIVLKTYDAVDNQRNFRGVLVSADDEKLKIDDVTKGLRDIPYGIISLARLQVD